MSLLASWPLILNWSPASVPPSPMATVMPGASRSACSRVTILCCWISACGITLTICGVSWTDLVIEVGVATTAWLGASASRWPVTSTSLDAASFKAPSTPTASARAAMGASVAPMGADTPRAKLAAARRDDGIGGERPR